MSFSDVLTNAAAVWFLVKSVEVVPFALYDICMFIKRLLEALSSKIGKDDINSENLDETIDTVEVQDVTSTDQDTNIEENEVVHYDRTRGRFEYVLAGDGFFDFSLLRRRKWKSFLITVLVPFGMFVIEMGTIFLGNEITVCQKSADLDRVAGPCLALFGNGQKETSMEQLFNQSFAGGSSNRRCVEWVSSISGVEYDASVCGFSPSVNDQIFTLLKVFPSTHWIGHMLPKKVTKTRLKYPLFVLSMPLQNSSKGAIPIGAVQFDAEVRVNGEGTLLQDVIRFDEISEEVKEKIRTDVQRFQELRNITGARYFERRRLLWISMGQLPGF